MSKDRITVTEAINWKGDSSLVVNKVQPSTLDQV
ncbi:hypothetical protein Smp_198770 [Schistosoma mansoni]|nr:hypothetical protein Smp_198770 [Schistosoma mansoni]|eukprot:XP_018645834.1 hypothetical protein Smp_198770 [Schistosoma mansoni]